MGLLAVVDTYLVYKIAEYSHNNKTVAFIAAVLFAVMPITWILRKIFLESILLPFLLLSILFALYSSNKGSIHFKYKTANRNVFGYKIKNQGTIFLVLLSGIFLSLSIFTKVPAFTMIPLVGYLICICTNTDKSSSNKNNHNIDFKKLGIWLFLSF
jgi:4-amino-4-deoxy-L-arabinose transferase-like glycosyltransferase